MQGLIRVDVSNPSQHSLVQKDCFDHAFGLFEALQEGLKVDFQGIGPDLTPET